MAFKVTNLNLFTSVVIGTDSPLKEHEKIFGSLKEAEVYMKEMTDLLETTCLVAINTETNRVERVAVWGDTYK